MSEAPKIIKVEVEAVVEKEGELTVAQQTHISREVNAAKFKDIRDGHVRAIQENVANITNRRTGFEEKDIT